MLFCILAISTDIAAANNAKTEKSHALDDLLMPTITCPANLTIECSDSSLPANTGTATATPNPDPIADITFTDVVLPGSCAGESTIQRTWTASDVLGNTTTCVQTIAVVDSTPPAFSQTPPNITVQCGNVPAVPAITATDNCDAAPTFNFAENMIAGACPNTFAMTRSWVSEDECGNLAQHIQLISVEDTTPPTALCQDITVNVVASGSATITLADIDAGSTDNCTATADLVLALDNDTFTCADSGPNLITLSATDECGNVGTCQATVTVLGSAGGNAPLVNNNFHCAEKTYNLGAKLNAKCADNSTITWWDAETGGVQLATGNGFDPVTDGGLDPTVTGCFVFYAQCGAGGGCSSDRTPAYFEIINCDIDCDDGCEYYLVLEDAESNGWDGASIDVSIAEAWPAANYKLNNSDCNGGYKVIPLSVTDGETIDLAYWNGAFETEHAWKLLNATFNTVIATGYDADDCNTEVPAIATHRAKAACPVCCENETEDFTVRITMGGFPEEQSWEIYSGTGLAQGPQVFGITANTYNGVAPGTQLTYDITLDKCETYTFAAFDGFNDSWDTGSWEIITSNIAYGTEITNLNDPLFGNSLVLSGPSDPAFVDEDRVTFTLPCQNCLDEELDVVTVGGACDWSGDLPVAEPFVCYPNCNHALPNGCLSEELIVLVNGDPNNAISLANGPFTYTDGLGTVPVANLPVGDHILVQSTTYCDGIISKCSTSLDIVSELNPTLTCNDLVHVTLGTPEWDDDDNNTGNTYQDDLGECVVAITPDMVLEMPNVCEDEYKVTILDGNDQPLVIYDVNGLPLDEAGQSIPAGNQSSIIAHNFVSSAQAGQTLTYVIEHINSDNVCWGEILVEDKYNPTITCVDYDVACTHPNALDEFYSHTEIYTPTMELPANIAGGTAGVVSNTFIPINLPCGAFGEMIQNIEIAVDIDHTDITDLQIILHAPSAAGIPATLLANNGDVAATNIFNTTNNSALLAFLGQACSPTASTSPEDFITENSGNNVPANVGGTWYIQIVDNNATFPTPPYGGGEVTAASISLTCGFAFPYAAYDCTLEGVTLLSETIVETHCDQSEWNGSKIIRVWQASDASGRTSTCTQTVGLKAPTMDAIAKPSDIALECNGQTPASLTPETTGGPSFDCFDLSDETHHGLCDMSYSYEDQVLPTCGQGFKIIRTWTFINWCSGVTKTMEQLIKVEDTLGPEINVADIVSNSAIYECSANISFNEAITDACSGVESISISYTLGGGAYAANNLVIIDATNGGTLEDLPVGITEIKIQAQDACLNVTEELVSITIEDNTAPVATCNDHFNVSLGSDGEAWINAEDIDEGSWDNCGVASIQVRRVAGCLGTSPWADSAPVACCDLGEEVRIELRVTDNAGNSNVCWQTVLVEDALAPTVTCPDNVTIDCNDPLLHDLAGLSVFGDAIYTDNCTPTATLVETDNRDQCKAGTITRTWTATDGSDKLQDATCTQTITVNHISDFIVQFPSDVTISTCPENLGATGEPIVSNDDCELVAVNYDDLILTIVDDACYKIERTWTLINWCAYDQGNPNNTDLGIPQPLPRTYQDDDGYFQYTQIIKVLDNEAPEFICPADLVFCDYTDACEGLAELPIQVLDDCSPDEVLEYTYKIDAFNDGSFDIIETGNDATGVYPYGTHLIKWIVEDGCGNTSSCQYLFTIEDCKNPTPVCLSGLAIENMQTGCVDVWASDFLEYAFDNCSDSDYVEASVKVRPAGSLLPLSNVITFCCRDVGTKLVEVWVEDEAGNSDFCTTYIVIQDNLNNCAQDESRASISGAIKTEGGEAIDEISTDLSGGTNVTSPTANNGLFAFSDLATGLNYSVRPEKDIDPLNGVSTFDLVLMSQHILGINTLDSPYKMIAADVNNDGNISTFDIVQTRQLILYIINDFPTNTSWRFVDKDFLFPNQNNPWLTSFPEEIHIAPLTQDELMADFVGVKIGDVSGDAVANSLLGAEERNIQGTLKFQLDEIQLEKGKSYDVAFKSSDFNEINGFQFTLNFDTEGLQFNAIQAETIEINEGNFGVNLLKEGVITASWSESNPQNREEEDVLFTLNFTSTVDALLSDLFTLNSRYTIAEAYSNTDLLDVALAFNSVNGLVENSGTFELFQNRPNPFNTETEIGFSLPSASEVSLKIYDVNGRVLKIVTNSFAKGYHQFTVQKSDLNVSGVLYYELSTATHSATKKMIILK